jgi:hypothetical protein
MTCLVIGHCLIIEYCLVIGAWLLVITWLLVIIWLLEIGHWLFKIATPFGLAMTEDFNP